MSPNLALSVENRCPLKCRQLEDKRTSPRHRESDVHDPERTWKLRHIECFAGRRRSFASPTAGISQIVSHPWTRPRGGRVNLLAHLDPRVLDHLCPMRNL